MGVFQNYFHLNQQMPTTSGFRGDFLFYNTRQHTVTKHKQFHATQNKTISSFIKQHTTTHCNTLKFKAFDKQFHATHRANNQFHAVKLPTNSALSSQFSALSSNYTTPSINSKSIIPFIGYLLSSLLMNL